MGFEDFGDPSRHILVFVLGCEGEVVKQFCAHNVVKMCFEIARNRGVEFVAHEVMVETINV